MNSNLPILIELHYFPSIQFFSKFFLASTIILEQQENYVKRSYRNRAHIATANGLLRLSIPLEKGKNEQQNIQKVKISREEPWQKKQWTAICSAYGNAPFFEYYIDDFRPFFETEATYLFEHNLAILNTLFLVLDFQPSFQLSETYQKKENSTFWDYRNKITPKQQSTLADPSYKNIPYQQVFAEKTGFLPNLSILDLIFCKGPETLSILENSALDE